MTERPETPDAPPRRVAILGLGLMGGSLGLALRAADPGTRVLGFDEDDAAARRALERGAATERLRDPGAVPAETEVVALAMPPDAAAGWVRALADSVPPGAIVMDLSSIMLPALSASLETPSLADRFVPAHPLAGSESSGIESARADLYRGAAVLIGLPLDAGTPGGRAAALWRALGARPASIAPALHDALVALTSHLPYAASVALVRTLRRTGSMTRALAETAGPGLRDTTRVAGSPPALWAEILERNGPKLLPALELLEREVRALRHAIQEGGPALRECLEEARSFREEIVR
ncbi:MAG TPA: prephenate dehydrogenase/arogenate dehydrogenase family protein [Candidatus Omnitrophota bacterium]|nr:prephenate dehydrogenase/arogenate dehydrogenase family protein [Candidatus Omnitrophota bacterium]